MQESKFTPPFKTLGTRLKYLREHSSESLAEVSGAVEINEDKLELIEQGIECPSEEILMLLINHFDMHEIEALQLWELAGYDRRNSPESVNFGLGDDSQATRMVMMLTYDTRAQYSDGVDISVTKAGLTLSFSQAVGNNQRQVVSRVGMSIQQAEDVSRLLEQALLRARYGHTKSLPAPKHPKSRRSKKAPKNSDK